MDIMVNTTVSVDGRQYADSYSNNNGHHKKWGQQNGQQRTLKMCRNCGRWLPLKSFYRNAQARDGHSRRCKECEERIREHRWEMASEADPKPWSDDECVMMTDVDGRIFPKDMELPGYISLESVPDQSLVDEPHRRGYVGELRKASLLKVG